MAQCRSAAAGSSSGKPTHHFLFLLSRVTAWAVFESRFLTIKKSLFDGLQEHGIELPHPDRLDEPHSAAKIAQVMGALTELQIFLIGFEGMSAREFCRTLWNQTLCEGCYVKKRHPGAITIMDVSHSIPRSEILEALEEAAKAGSIQ